jgi:hypothetical protein
MKTLFYYLFSWMFATFNVANYGAVGDGVTDDTNAIKACLAAAQTAHGNVYFPKGVNGVYLINKNSGVPILTFDISTSTNTAIYGDNVTLLTNKDTATTQLVITATLRSVGFTITGINFLNKHDPMQMPTCAVQFEGTGSNLIDTTYILGCSFDGFSTAVVEQGMQGILMDQDHFRAWNGHNSAETNNTPATWVLWADNVNGQCYNVTVQNCDFNGYTGTGTMTAPRPMDGSTYGYPYGLNFWFNSIANISQEGIFVQAPTTNTSTTAPILIQNNFVDCTILPGWTDSAGGKHNYNYGIRVDCGYATIDNNKIRNYTSGIMCRPIDYSGFQATNTTITNNKESQGQDTTIYSVSGGIIVSAASGKPYLNMNISNNKSYGVESSPISLSNVTSPTQLNNYWTKPILAF